MSQFTLAEQIWIVFGALSLGVVVAVTLAVILSVVHDIRHPLDVIVCESCRTVGASSDRYGKATDGVCRVCHERIP